MQKTAAVLTFVISAVKPSDLPKLLAPKRQEVYPDGCLSVFSVPIDDDIKAIALKVNQLKSVGYDITTFEVFSTNDYDVLYTEQDIN